MNQQFNLSRFSLVLKAYWAVSGKNYLLLFGLIMGTMLLLMIPIISTSQFNGLLYGLHILTLFGGVVLGGCAFTNTAFTAYTTSAKGMATIMVPASRLEKFIPILITCLLGTVSVILIGFWLHSEIVELANRDMLTKDKYEVTPLWVWQFFTYIHFILQGAIFFGSIYFNKNSLIKTLGAVLVVAIFAFMFNLLLTYHFTGYPSSVMSFPFTFWNIFESGQRFTVKYPPAISDLVELVPAVIAVALIGITYARLREKEI
ncbi:MAG: hypothetical protein WBA23_07060 [Tunicatimonas sp.]|uniref:hypothetical protein n=1 Tax=Tunicatimonas sp. TaxID=1940096 RepID=UPI003C744609